MKEAKVNLFETKAKSLPVELEFYPETATAVLTVDKNNIDLEAKRALAEQLGLLAKKEFHFTVIGKETGERILKVLENSDEIKRNRVLTQIRELVQAVDWRVVLDDDFYYITKDYNEPDPGNPGKTIPETRRSIVQMARVDELAEFYRKFNDLLGEDFATPLPHLTLFTNSTREDKKLRGIGIYSPSQFKELKPEKV